jgi:hypothetical protein
MDFEIHFGAFVFCVGSTQVINAAARETALRGLQQPAKEQTWQQAL